jgi:hypothetical protein
MAENSSEWQARFEPAVTSYFAAMVRQVFRRLGSGDGIGELSYRRREKVEVNSALIRQIVQDCRREKLRIAFVVFSAYLKSGQSGWRERFLRETFEEEGVSFLDTRAYLTRMAEKESRPVTDYVLDDGHLNAEGNALVARQLAEFLERAYGIGPDRWNPLQSDSRTVVR